MEYTTPRIDPNVNSGLGAIMMGQCGFNDCNKCPTLVEDADEG